MSKLRTPDQKTLTQWAIEEYNRTKYYSCSGADWPKYKATFIEGVRRAFKEARRKFKSRVKR